MAYNETTSEVGAAGVTDFSCEVAVDRPGVTRVKVTGELDLATAPHLRSALPRAADGAAVVIVDLSGLTFMDSSGLETIVDASARLEGANCELVLVPGPHQVQRLLELTGVAEKLRFTNGNHAAAEL